jgi:hypothetical protein
MNQSGIKEQNAGREDIKQTTGYARGTVNRLREN